MSKIIEVFIHFSKDEWVTLRSKYTEQEIKWLVSKGADKLIAIECEKINSDNFQLTPDSDESEKVG
jgi:hypothetical protein